MQMLERGDRNRGRLDFRAGVDHLLDRTESARTIEPGDVIGPDHVGVRYGEQANRFSLLLKLVIHTRVILPKCTCTYYGDVDCGVRGQKSSRRELVIKPQR